MVYKNNNNNSHCRDRCVYLQRNKLSIPYLFMLDTVPYLKYL